MEFIFEMTDSHNVYLLVQHSKLPLSRRKKPLKGCARRHAAERLFAGRALVAHHVHGSNKVGGTGGLAVAARDKRFPCRCVPRAACARLPCRFLTVSSAVAQIARRKICRCVLLSTFSFRTFPFHFLCRLSFQLIALLNSDAHLQ